jgi:dienelactone hydrolase
MTHGRSSLLFLFSTALLLPPACSSGQNSTTASFETHQKAKVTYQIFGAETGKPTLILLHGASGPGGDLYQDQARYFAAHGYRVLMPHYFDATRTTTPSDENYRLWADAVLTLIRIAKESDTPVVLVGYSLGASVGLAVGSQANPAGGQTNSVAAIAEWYGSLPDEFFYRLQGMPPLLILHGEQDANIPVVNARQLIKLCELRKLTCESHLYPDQAHGFDTAVLKDADARTLAFLSRFVPAQQTGAPDVNSR